MNTKKRPTIVKSLAVGYLILLANSSYLAAYADPTLSSLLRFFRSP
jgi:hypothetical protein